MRRTIWISFLAVAAGLIVWVWYLMSAKASVPPRPSTFFEWCESEKFGERSPEGTLLRRADTEYVGELEAARGTSARTSIEAEDHLKQAARGLVREMNAKGCKVDSSYIGPELVMVTYNFESISGLLYGSMEPNEIEPGVKRSTAWWIHWKLTERPTKR